MKKIYLLHILHIIRYNLSIEKLVDMGLEYYQIAKLIKLATETGYLFYNEEAQLHLTELGQKTLSELNNSLFPLNKTKWIMPMDEFRIDKIGKFDVYLPKNRKPI